MSLAEKLRPAVSHLATDGFVAYPTETVWGLGACADRPQAVDRLMAWKGRADDAPMSVLVPGLAAAVRIGCQLAPAARRLADAFWPGPLTLVVPCETRFARGVAGADGALGLRCSPHPVAQGLAIALEAAGLGPLTSTSLNRSGEPPARDFETARALAGERSGRLDVPLLAIRSDDVSGGEKLDAGGSTPSSVVDCSGTAPRLLREGAIARERLERVWSEDASPRGAEREPGGASS